MKDRRLSISTSKLYNFSVSYWSVELFSEYSGNASVLIIANSSLKPTANIRIYHKRHTCILFSTSSQALRFRKMKFHVIKHDFRIMCYYQQFKTVKMVISNDKALGRVHNSRGFQNEAPARMYSTHFTASEFRCRSRNSTWELRHNLTHIQIIFHSASSKIK